MRTQLLITTAIIGLLFAGPALAGTKYEDEGMRNPQRGPGLDAPKDRCELRQECRQDRREFRQERRMDRREFRQDQRMDRQESRMDRREMRKSMKHRKMAMKYENKAMRHRDMARMHAERFHAQGFGPQMGPGPMAMGPPCSSIP
jgi:hypothetical protein